jgi:hypothetical protein
VLSSRLPADGTEHRTRKKVKPNEVDRLKLRDIQFVITTVLLILAGIVLLYGINIVVYLFHDIQTLSSDAYTNVKLARAQAVHDAITARKHPDKAVLCKITDFENSEQRSSRISSFELLAEEHISASSLTSSQFIQMILDQDQRDKSYNLSLIGLCNYNGIDIVAAGLPPDPDGCSLSDRSLIQTFDHRSKKLLHSYRTWDCISSISLLKAGIKPTRSWLKVTCFEREYSLFEIDASGSVTLFFDYRRNLPRENLFTTSCSFMDIDHDDFIEAVIPIPLSDVYLQTATGPTLLSDWQHPNGTHADQLDRGYIVVKLDGHSDQPFTYTPQLVLK